MACARCGGGWRVVPLFPPWMAREVIAGVAAGFPKGRGVLLPGPAGGIGRRRVASLGMP